MAQTFRIANITPEIFAGRLAPWARAHRDLACLDDGLYEWTLGMPEVLPGTDRCQWVVFFQQRCLTDPALTPPGGPAEPRAAFELRQHTTDVMQVTAADVAPELAAWLDALLAHIAEIWPEPAAQAITARDSLERPKQPTGRRLDDWFVWYHAMHDGGHRCTLAQIATATGYEHGYVKQEHMRYKAERKNELNT